MRAMAALNTKLIQLTTTVLNSMMMLPLSTRECALSCDSSAAAVPIRLTLPI
jgi:hypothetical protein